jgi:hypothetical protein
MAPRGGQTNLKFKNRNISLGSTTSVFIPMFLPCYDFHPEDFETFRVILDLCPTCLEPYPKAGLSARGRVVTLFHPGKVSAS